MTIEHRAVEANAEIGGDAARQVLHGSGVQVSRRPMPVVLKNCDGATNRFKG